MFWKMFRSCFKARRPSFIAAHPFSSSTDFLADVSFHRMISKKEETLYHRHLEQPLALASCVVQVCSPEPARDRLSARYHGSICSLHLILVYRWWLYHRNSSA